jgi:hypothetical protein
MSFNGTGIFYINTPGQPVVTGTTITSTAFNALTTDLATGLTNCLTKDGQSTPTANIKMGNYKLTGLGVATTTGDALSFGNLATISTLTLTNALTVPNGGTGAVTLTGYVKGNGTSAFTASASIPAADVTSAALTRVDDTNVTLTLGGSPTTALLAATSLTLGWTGTLSVARGGSGAATLTGILKGNGTGAFTAVTAPTGTIVGTTDTQTLTGKTLSTTNTIDAGTAVSDTGTIAVTSVGFRGLPQNSQTASYTLALTDAGKHISTTTGGVIIPANGSVAFPIGSSVVIFNNSGSSQTISITTDTLRLAGTASTGSRTLAQYGLCTVVKITATVWAISGAGVT